MSFGITLMMKFFSLSRMMLALLGLATSAFVYAQQPEQVQEMETIVVTATEGTKKKANIITTESKDESTETDLRGLLADEPSIGFGGGNGTSQYITIRGMGQNSIDVKVDNAYSDSQILYHQGRFMLDPSLVKIVEVQKGAGSASAGIGATNGAIVAKTVDALDLLKNSDRDYGFKLNGGYNSNDGYSYGASAFGKTDNFDALVAYNAVIDNDYKAGEGFLVNGSDTVPYSGLDKLSYLAKFGINLGKHRFVASHLNETHKGMRTVREEFTVFEGNNRQAPTYRETSNTNTNLEWTAKDLGRVKDATANVYLLTNERYSADDTNNGYAGNIAGPTTTKIDTKGANLNLDWGVSDSTIVKTGLNYRHQEVKPSKRLTATDMINVGTQQRPNRVPLGIDIINPEKTDVGAYVEAISQVKDVTVTAGVRYDHFNFKAMDGKTVSDSSINPSVGIIWQAMPSLRLSANHSYASRSPRMYDALMSHGNRGITSIADGTVAERARNTEIGFNYKYDFANAGSLEANGSYFWQRIDDAVVNPQSRHDINAASATSGVEAAREIMNAGYITNKGYEVDLTYTLQGFTAKAGVAHSDPVFHGLPTINTNELNPEFGAKIGRTWTSSLAYRFDQPNVEIGVRNRSVEKSKGSLNENVLTPQNRESYSVTDVFANWKPLNNDKLNVNFGINNITDEYYRPHSQRPNAGLPAVGRDFRIGFNYTF